MNTIANTANRSIIGINASIDFDLFVSDLVVNMFFTESVINIRNNEINNRLV